MREDRRHTAKDCWAAAPLFHLFCRGGRPNAGHGWERRPSSSLLLCPKVISYLPVVERVAFPPLSIQ